MNRVPRGFAPMAMLAFALSGCAGLIYQSIWSQYLGLYLGHAAYAQSLVLAIFMGGMAIGAWWASRRSLSWRNLLRAYALIELVIGVAAALFHPVYTATTGFAYDHAFPALPGTWAVQAFKWSSGTLLILPQAILLGMTFPLMSNGLMRRLRAGSGAILGGLYFTNSIGAAFGALFATFVLLPKVGLPGAMQFGAILNIVVAVIAWLLGRGDETPLLPTAAEAGTAHAGGNLARLLLTAAFVTGATSFVYEIGWVRMLALAFGSTVHAFELMLAAFIGGLAFGGLWIRRRIDGYPNPIRIGGWVQIAMGLAALATLFLYDRSFEWVAWFQRALSRTDGGYLLYNAVTGTVAVLLMAPAAFFAGMTLPLFTFALLRNGGGEASVGRIYAANTIGAIVGVFATVHLLIPGLGLKLAMCIGAAGDLLLGLALLRRTGPAANRTDGPYLGAVVACGIALAVVLVGARFDPDTMAAGVYRSGNPRLSNSGTKVLSYRDGKTASIATTESAVGIRAISTNGKIDAGIRMTADGKASLDEITMVLAGMLPLLHHPDPRTAAVIGFGSGLTTNTLLGDPRLERVDTIEIEPAMVDGARVFGKHVERAYKDPRSHIHIEDAKTFFAANRASYDIIVAEPSNPWVSGVASLFSREFYHFVPRHLRPGGLFVQWIQLYEINDELVGAIAHALSSSFSDYRIYLSYNADMLIVARADGDVGDIHTEVLQSPALKDVLERVDIATPEDVMAHRIGDRRSLSALFDAMSQRTTSDFHPFLTLEAPLARFTDRTAEAVLNLPAEDLPYRKVLGRLAPPPQSIVASPSFDYTAWVRKGAVVADALRDGRRPDDASLSQQIAIAQLSLTHCEANGANDSTLEDALVVLAGRTIPVLDTERLRPVWITPAWSRCTPSASTQALLKVIAALADARWSEAQQDAVAMLRSPTTPALQAATREWLLRAAMLAGIAAGHYADVEDIHETLGRTVPANELGLRYRSYLRLFARARAAEQGTPAAAMGAATPAR